MEQKIKILAIVPQEGIYSKLEPLLRRDSFEVSRAANATGSLILATNVGYSVIIAEYPLPDLSIVDFLGILQAPTLPSSQSQILLIAKHDHLDAVAKHVDTDDRVRVMSQDSSPEAIQGVLASMLSGVAERKDSRLMVQLEANLEAGKLLRMCQTSNVSESGMLIHTSRMLPIQSEVEVSFFLPADPRPINARVQVVRHSDPQREHVEGIGVRFTQMAQAAREKLQDFVNNRWVAPEEPLAEEVIAQAAEQLPPTEAV